MRKRRRKGEGSRRLRDDGRIEHRVTVAPGRVKSVYGYTDAEVDVELAKLRTQLAVGSRTKLEKERLGDYLAAWLSTKTLAPSTRHIYARAIDNLSPELSRTRIGALTSGLIRMVYLQSKLTPWLLCQLDDCLRSALLDAVKDGGIELSPLAGVSKPKRPRVDYQTISPEQVAKLVSHARDYEFSARTDIRAPKEAAFSAKLYTAIPIIGVLTGMREGEILGLSWRDVDLRTGAVRIQHSLTEVDSKMILGPTKTASSRRTITLPKVAREVLEEHRKRQLDQAPRGAPSTEAEIHMAVFRGPRGEWVRKSNFIVRVFKRILAACAFDGIDAIKFRFHDLRHTCATNLLRAGVPIHDVSKLLGHASVITTMRIYGHALNDDGKKTAAAIDNLYGVGKGSGE